MAPTAKQIGDYGEKVAADFLRTKGIRILYRQFRTRTMEEIDLIVRDKKTLVFVEVKTRAFSSWGSPIEAVDKLKQLRLEKAANIWIKALKTPPDSIRFDVVEIYWQSGYLAKINHFENAF